MLYISQFGKSPFLMHGVLPSAPTFLVRSPGVRPLSPLFGGRTESSQESSRLRGWCSMVQHGAAPMVNPTAGLKNSRVILRTEDGWLHRSFWMVVRCLNHLQSQCFPFFDEHNNFAFCSVKCWLYKSFIFPTFSMVFTQ